MADSERPGSFVGGINNKHVQRMSVQRCEVCFHFFHNYDGQVIAEAIICNSCLKRAGAEVPVTSTKPAEPTHAQDR